MTLLIVGLIIFFTIHLVPALTGLKRSLIGRLGENGYQGVFSLVSAVGLGLIIWGYTRADFVAAYDPPAWGRHATMLLVLPAFICLAAFNLKGRIKKTLRHPMLVGIILWGTGHLLANGDMASVLLFGSFVAYAVLDILLANAQGRVKTVEVTPVHDLYAVIGGVVVYGVVVLLHPYVIGVPVIV
ncbi:MAG: NnrU family protein [Hyphomicrobiales bacterium]